MNIIIYGYNIIVFIIIIIIYSNIYKYMGIINIE